MDYADKLRLYAQSTVSKHQALDASLAKAKYRSKHWEGEAKVGEKRIVWAEKGRDEAKKEAQVTRLAIVTAGDTKVKAEDDLAKV